MGYWIQCRPTPARHWDSPVKRALKPWANGHIHDLNRGQRTAHCSYCRCWIRLTISQTENEQGEAKWNNYAISQAPPTLRPVQGDHSILSCLCLLGTTDVKCWVLLLNFCKQKENNWNDALQAFFSLPFVFCTVLLYRLLCCFCLILNAFICMHRPACCHIFPFSHLLCYCSSVFQKHIHINFSTPFSATNGNY